MVSVKIDAERSSKETIQNSIVGKLIISEYVCEKCGTPALSDWTKCINCDSTRVIKRPVPKP